MLYDRSKRSDADKDRLYRHDESSFSWFSHQYLQALLNGALPPADASLGCTNWAEHEIDVGNARPIRQKQYPISRKLEEETHQQVREMLAAGLIEPSSSPWASPAVWCRKLIINIAWTCAKSTLPQKEMHTRCQIWIRSCGNFKPPATS